MLNAAPVAIADTYSTPLATRIDRIAPGWLANDTDADGNSLQLSVVSTPQHGNISWTESGNWNYAPQDTFAGVDRLQYQITDGMTQSAPADVRIRVGSYSQMILADAPLAYWPLDNRQTANDLSGNGNHGTYDGVIAGVPGAIAAESTTGAEFETGNCHIYLGVRPQLNALQNNISLEAWIKPSALSGHGRIFTNSQYDTNRGFAFGTFEKSLAFTAFGIQDYISKPVFNDLNRWYHVAVVFDSGNDASFYVNGQLIDQVAGTAPPQTTQSASMLGLQWDFDQRFRGTMDEVAIYRRSLTDGDIARHYEMGVVAAGKIPAATADYYRLRQDSQLSIDIPSVEVPRHSFVETFSADVVGANFVDPAGAFFTANDRLHTSQERQYLLTAKSDYIRGDFRFEVDVDLTTSKQLIQYVGIGSGERESAYNEPYPAVALRFHSATIGGDLALTNAGPSGSVAFAKLTKPGYHRVRMTKTGDHLLVEVDAQFDGVFHADYAHEVTSLARYAPFLNETNSHLLVGGSPLITFDNFQVQSSLDPLLVPGVLANDRDGDGPASMKARLVTGPQHGVLQLRDDGTFTYQPQAGFHGEDQFVYRVDDDTNISSEATVSLEVVSPMPIARSDRYTTQEDTELRLDDVRSGVLQNDRDPDELPLLAQLESSPAHGTLTFAENGTFRYQPAANYAGSDSFSYSVSNGTYRSLPVAVEIVIAAVNDRPLAVNDEYTLGADNTIDVPVERGLLANDFDEEGDALRATLQLAPTRGQVTIAPNGSFQYTAGNTFGLTDQFTYTVRDSSGASLPATVLLKRNAPTITAPQGILRANTPGQQLQIRVAGGQAVSGLDFFLQLGDGGPELVTLGLPAGTPGPRITGVDLKTDTIFAGTVDSAVDLGSLPQLANWSFSNTQGANIAAEGLLATITVDTTGFFGGEWSLQMTGLLPNHPFGPLNTTFAGKPAFVVDGQIRVIPSEIKGRYVFYNDSSWDGHKPGADAADDSAIATDKQPLLPGQTASFANYTSYTKGINGVMIDIAGLASVELLRSSDFRFRVGRTTDISTWQDAPTPNISVRKGAGIEGSDRITLIWPAGVIQQQWLEVTVPAGATTLLAADDRFYFGNVIGEVGNQAGNTLVTSIDVISARDHQRGPFSLAAIDDVYDFNRDRLVSAADVIAGRDHQVGPLMALPLISPSRVAPVAARAVFARLGDVNGDGRFDTRDLIAVFQSGQFEDGLSGNSNWWYGDWNQDHEFDTQDLLLALQFGYDEDVSFDGTT